MNQLTSATPSELIQGRGMQKLHWQGKNGIGINDFGLSIPVLQKTITRKTGAFIGVLLWCTYTNTTLFVKG